MHTPADTIDDSAVVSPSARHTQPRAHTLGRRPACANVLPFRQYRMIFTRVNRSCARVQIYNGFVVCDRYRRAKLRASYLTVGDK